MLRNRDELGSLLRQAFDEGVSWPIDRPSLRALSHMGLTVAQIARYFSIDPVEVQALLNDRAPNPSHPQFRRGSCRIDQCGLRSVSAS